MRTTLVPSLDPATYPFAHSLRVRFAETDAMGIVHHGAYLPYLDVQADDGIDFAVLEASVRYLQPLRFDDVVTVHLLVGGASRATFQIAYLLTVAGRPHATGVTVHGCVDPTGRPQRMPAWLREMTA